MNLASLLPGWLRGGSATPAAAPAAAPEARQAEHVQARRPVQRVARRNFNGAATDNLTASFKADHVSLNEDLERSLRILRGRSRNLAKNNDYVRKFLRMCQNHIVGPNGFALSVPCVNNAGAIDELDKAVCEKAFAKWSKRGVCDITGRLSFLQLQRLLILICARDGEFIVRRVKGAKLNAFGYALQVIDPVLLDETFRADFNDGRRIRMGVETTQEGKVLAYHFLSDVESAWGAKRVRVDAAEIWHGFIQSEPNQVRGVPWIHSAMRSLNDLGGYVEAAVIAARVGASNMGFFVPPADAKGDAGGLASEVINHDDGTTELVKDATPGTFEELPPGYDFKNFNPDYPHQNFDGFVKAMLRGISGGVGADYPTLSGDLEGVNYNSLRHGKLETQDEWMCLQTWFSETFHGPLWPEFLEMGFASNQLTPLPVSKFEKYNVAVWQGRRWPWVDPLKDMQARQMELDACLTSYSDVMRELGRDPEAVWRQMEKDVERMAKLKKRLAELQPKQPAPAQPAGASTSATEKEPVDE